MVSKSMRVFHFGQRFMEFGGDHAIRELHRAAADSRLNSETTISLTRRLPSLA
jgi:hypothetical protein